MRVLSVKDEYTKMYNKAELLGQEKWFSSLCFSIWSWKCGRRPLQMGMVLSSPATATQFPHSRFSLLRWKMKMVSFAKCWEPTSLIDASKQVYFRANTCPQADHADCFQTLSLPISLTLWGKKILQHTQSHNLKIKLLSKKRLVHI